MVVVWRGSKYKRSDSSLRDRHSGIIYKDVKRIGNRYVGIGKIGVEPRRATPYGKNPRSSSQAIKDLKSFHQSIPERLKRK